MTSLWDPRHFILAPEPNSPFVRVDCRKYLWRRHRKLGQPLAGRALNCVGDGGERRTNIDLGGAFGAVGMAGIRHFAHHRLDHRQVGGYWNPIIEKARIFHVPFRIVDVFLVERPADALRNAALDLPFDITRVDRPTDVLRGDETQHGHLARLRIDFDVAELSAEAGCHDGRINCRFGDDGPARRCPLLRDILNRERLEITDIAACRLGATIFPSHAIWVDVSHLGCTETTPLDYLFGRVDPGEAGGEGDARSAGQMSISH